MQKGLSHRRNLTLSQKLEFVRKLCRVANQCKFETVMDLNADASMPFTVGCRGVLMAVTDVITSQAAHICLVCFWRHGKRSLDHYGRLAHLILLRIFCLKRKDVVMLWWRSRSWPQTSRIEPTPRSVPIRVLFSNPPSASTFGLSLFAFHRARNISLATSSIR